MIDFENIEKHFLDDLEMDYIPLNDVVREFSGFDHAPTEEDFLNALSFLEYVCKKYPINYVKGPGNVPITMSLQEFLDWLKQLWYLGQYNQIDYGIWFERNE